MGVGAAHTAGEDAAEVVFARVQRDDLFGGGAQKALADAARDDDFGDDVFAAPQDTIDCARFFVGTVVGGNRAVGKLRKFSEQPGNSGIGGLGNHVVAGSVAAAAFQAQIKQIADNFGVQVEQAGKTAGGGDDGGEFVAAGADRLQCGKGRRGIGGGEEDGARHALIDNGAAHAAAMLGDLRAACG